MSLGVAAPSPVLPPADVASLRGALARLRRQARRWVWVETLGLLALWGAAVFWVTLLADWTIEPPWQVRAGLLVAIGVGLAALVVTKLIRRLAVPLDDSQLALLVERTHPQFGDSLCTAVELADGPRDDVNEALLERATSAAVARMGDVRPEAIFRRGSLGTLAGVAVLALGSVVGLAAVQPAAAGLWVSRMLLLRDTAWPRRVRLEAEGFTDGVRVVARGTDVEVLVRAMAERAIPEIVDLRFRPSGSRGVGWRTDRMGTRGGPTPEGQVFGHVIKGIGESLDMEVRGGDARLRPLRLQVVEPPALEALEISAVLPAYLGGGTRRAATSRVVAVPRGSDVEIVCTSSKPLSAATLAVVEGGAEVAVAELPTRSGGSPPRSITARLDDVGADRTVVVRFTDTDGLVNRDPITFTISAVPDEPPQVSLRLRGISTAVTPLARIPLEGTISDDHGLADAAIAITVAAPGDDGAAAREVVQPIGRVRPGAAMVEWNADAPETVAVQPLSAAIGSRLTLTPTASDGCAVGDGPNRTMGASWTLDVVSPEALQAMLEAREVILRRRFESVVADCGQSRDRLAAAPAGDEATVATARMAESAARAAGETTEIAAAFQDIRLELANNGLLTPEVDVRLIQQIAVPLSVIADRDLPALAAACRATAGSPASLVRQADAVLAKMRAVLAMMMELESFNEVIEQLRGVIRTQEEIRSDTLDQQKKRAREALEGL